MTAAVLAALGCLVGAPLTVAAASSTGLNLFDFDFKLGAPQSQSQRHDQRFRWYKLLPRTGFRLLKVGPRYQASASSDYFQTLSNTLACSLEFEPSYWPTAGRSVDRGDADVSLPVENLTCRFWGQPPPGAAALLGAACCRLHRAAVRRAPSGP
uniref:Lysosomal Pro-X carboxypeptidase n=1 Tax=Macrostomum lignano TaxID=282301 RepID=A0A1I8F687_9PLAT